MLALKETPQEFSPIPLTPLQQRIPEEVEAVFREEGYLLVPARRIAIAFDRIVRKATENGGRTSEKELEESLLATYMSLPADERPTIAQQVLQFIQTRNISHISPSHDINAILTFDTLLCSLLKKLEEKYGVPPESLTSPTE